MLHKVKPNSPILQSDPYRPAFIEPLISAVASNRSTTDAMQAIIRKFGFETFLYAMATAPHLDVESQIYFWTNQPREWIVELRSLKFYINGYRDRPISHEGATNQILNDLVTLLDPRWMRVTADFTVRGNIKTVVTVEHGCRERA